jgi:hypothetical protein
MDIEIPEESSPELATVLKKIENIEKKINAIKLLSQNRKTARKQLLLQQRKAQIRKLSQQEEEISKLQHPNPKFRKD